MPTNNEVGLGARKIVLQPGCDEAQLVAALVLQSSLNFPRFHELKMRSWEVLS